MEVTRLNNRLILIAVALSVTTMTLVPAASAQGCDEPADGIAVCDVDDDDQPDLVVAEAGADGVGSATLTAKNIDSEHQPSRGVKADLTSADGSPVGSNAAEARAICTQSYNEDEPCNNINLGLVAENTTHRRLVAGAGCGDAFAGTVPTCDYLSSSVDARNDGDKVRVVYICGGVGFFSMPCPLEHSFGADLETPAGGADVFGGYSPVFGLGVCADSSAADGACLP